MKDITILPFVAVRLPLLATVNRNNPHEVKHSQDRTTSPVRKYFDAVTKLRVARSETMSCLEAKPGRADGVTLVICERERFDELQEKIAGLQAEIASLEDAITKLDTIITSNELGDGWLEDLRHRIESAGSNVIRQQSNISSWAGFFTTKHAGKSPEEALQDPEFVERRAEAERLIELDKAYIERFKPIKKEIEQILMGVGC